MDWRAKDRVLHLTNKSRPPLQEQPRQEPEEDRVGLSTIGRQFDYEVGVTIVRLASRYHLDVNIVANMLVAGRFITLQRGLWRRSGLQMKEAVQTPRIRVWRA